jgi:hypothetical protein
VAAWVPDMFRNFYEEKNYKAAYNSATTHAIEKICKDSESVEF